MNLPPVYLFVQTLIIWCIVIFLHRKKTKYTLVPLYAFLAALTVLTHNLSDIGFAVVVGDLYFMIASTSFFTSLMLGILFIYLFEGPRATRLAASIIIGISIFYVGLVTVLSLQADTSKWIPLTPELYRVYFWSLTAIILDVFFIPIAWELLGKVKKIPLLIRVLVVFVGTYYLDSLVFVTGAFVGKPFYLSMLQGSILSRTILALIMSPIAAFYLKSGGYSEEERKRPQNFWEILNFRSDLENKVQTMEEMLVKQKELESELRVSEERYALALEGANAGIWDWDIVRDRIMFSPRFCALLGYDAGELDATIDGFKLLVHPDDLKKTFDALEECFKSRCSFNIEYRLKNKNGAYKWYQTGGATKFDASGRPIRMVGSTIDVDERKKITESYENQVRELERFNKLMVDRELKMVELKDEIDRLKKGKV